MVKAPSLKKKMSKLEKTLEEKMKIANKKIEQMKVRVAKLLIYQGCTSGIMIITIFINVLNIIIISNMMMMMMMMISGVFSYGGFSYSYILRSYFGCMP